MQRWLNKRALSRRDLPAADYALGSQYCGTAMQRTLAINKTSRIKTRVDVLGLTLRPTGGARNPNDTDKRADLGIVREVLLPTDQFQHNLVCNALNLLCPSDRPSLWCTRVGAGGWGTHRGLSQPTQPLPPAIRNSSARNV